MAMKKFSYTYPDMFLDYVTKAMNKAKRPTDELRDPPPGRGPRTPYTGPKEARMYGSGVESNVADKSDRLDLKDDPNQTARPRISMDPAEAAPMSKGKKVVQPPLTKSAKSTKPAKKKTETDKLGDWITSISR
jgi:hypothetical protein